MWPEILSLLAACASDAPEPLEPEAVLAAPLPASHQPPRVEDIPEGDFGDSVRRGRDIFMDVQTHAPEYAGNTLSCRNCHIDEGRKADAAPMWAAFVSYPAYRSKNGHVNDLNERIRGCFTYSMDAQSSPAGQAPAPDDPVIIDLETYAYWLATGLELGAEPKGRGFPELERPAQVDSDNGALLYQQRCMACHGADGQGLKSPEGVALFPPLWGEESYNWGAGMHRVNTAAGFIYANMPLGQERSLSEQEAWDVALFIDSQERPQDPRYASGEAERDFHDHDCTFHEQGAEHGS